MKMTKFGFWALVILITGTLAFGIAEGGSISGKVIPEDGATEAWAITGVDTLKAAIVNGTFSIQPVKAGTYTVIINAKAPYKNVTLPDVKVVDGKVTDFGEIKLEK
ncbi:hypothetical protein SAMN05518672_102325 [Chitinophaga sp. CF118]|uniref:carboxypeptidase regulatory-like domain-containing protein n=1 Tax=Chitinophaga sp. CF118 TaxID=1884367 RepID=UPI0008E7BA20|nr:carboxypeptidase regulatory-like domain-containing protein [Chitinophaga sp. CF118]SFD53252.1 hypothetical protein SAMN05518672_102325 [Chitinophaga sp. CF118]